MSAQKCSSKSKIQPNPSVFVTIPKVCGTCINFTGANHALITQEFCVLNEQRQALARIVKLGQNSVPHTWLLNTEPNVYDNRGSDLHQLPGVAQMRVLHGLMNGPSIMTMMIYHILDCCQDRTMRLTERGDFVFSYSDDER
jgi:hypothetical protein